MVERLELDAKVATTFEELKDIVVKIAAEIDNSKEQIKQRGKRWNYELGTSSDFEYDKEETT